MHSEEHRVYHQVTDQRNQPYLERVVERPGRKIEISLRVLFKPLDEHAQLLVFGASQGQYIIESVKDARRSRWGTGSEEDPRFAAELEAAKELARKWIYAAQAGG